MNRTELQDRLNYCKRELDMLENVTPNCMRCLMKDATAPVCQKYGPIPAEFLVIGCDAWEFDDVPF